MAEPSTDPRFDKLPLPVRLRNLAGEPWPFPAPDERDTVGDLMREAADALERAATYAEANPLGGPASMFDTIARRIRMGEPVDAVLADYDLVRKP